MTVQHHRMDFTAGACARREAERRNQYQPTATRLQRLRARLAHRPAAVQYYMVSQDVLARLGDLHPPLIYIDETRRLTPRKFETRRRTCTWPCPSASSAAGRYAPPAPSAADVRGCTS